MLHTKETLNTYMAAFCDQSVDKLRLDTDRDFYMTPQEALSYGIIDEVIQHKNMIKTPKIPSLRVSYSTSLFTNHVCERVGESVTIRSIPSGAISHIFSLANFTESLFLSTCHTVLTSFKLTSFLNDNLSTCRSPHHCQYMTLEMSPCLHPANGHRKSSRRLGRKQLTSSRLYHKLKDDPLHVNVASLKYFSKNNTCF